MRLRPCILVSLSPTVSTSQRLLSMFAPRCVLESPSFFRVSVFLLRHCVSVFLCLRVGLCATERIEPEHKRGEPEYKH